MDELVAMQAFVMVSELGSFSRAASQLGMEVSSVARRVASLEAELNVSLLERSRRPVAMTDEGRIYYQHATRILRYSEEARRLLSDRTRNVIRAIASVSFGRARLSPLLPSFLKEHPRTAVELVLSDAEPSWLEFDVQFRNGPTFDATLTQHRLATQRFVLCASDDYVRASGVPRHPSELTNHRCLLQVQEGADTWAFRSRRKTSSVRVVAAMRSNDWDVLREAACGGAGVLLAPTWLVERDLADRRLLPLLEDMEVGIGGTTDIYAVHMPDRGRALGPFLGFVRRHWSSTSKRGR